jgi:hypothetical protein
VLSDQQKELEAQNQMESGDAEVEEGLLYIIFSYLMHLLFSAS